MRVHENMPYCAFRSFLADFRDSSARTWKSESAVADMAKVIVPSVAASATAVTELIKLTVVAVPVLLTRLVPVVVVIAACLFAISSKSFLQVGPASDTRSLVVNDAFHVRYRFSDQVRCAAKWCLPVLTVILVFNCVTALPNGVAGIRAVSGRLCLAGTESPASGAVVDLLDAYGGIVSMHPEVADDRGFFASDVAALGQAPSTLRVRYSQCPLQDVPISTGTAIACRSGGVPLDGIPSADDSWILSCRN
jgi:hypothetical protein